MHGWSGELEGGWEVHIGIYWGLYFKNTNDSAQTIFARMGKDLEIAWKKRHTSKRDPSLRRRVLRFSITPIWVHNYDPVWARNAGWSIIRNESIVSVNVKTWFRKTRSIGTTPIGEYVMYRMAWTQLNHVHFSREDRRIIKTIFMIFRKRIACDMIHLVAQRVFNKELDVEEV